MIIISTYCHMERERERKGINATCNRIIITISIEKVFSFLIR